ncbi:MAG TPA: ATP-binding protein [Woeseiaceae bacterium]|nr:ATP-binding protein [Woeseiaceae bacterium]
MKTRMRSRFRLLSILQVALIVVTVAALAWSIFESNHIAVPAVILILVILQAFLLIRSVEKHVDTLEEFFAAINYEDFTQRFVSGTIDDELRDSFNLIIEKFQQARAQRELQANYLEVVMRHVPVPLIAARSDDSLRLVNNPVRRLTGLSSLRHLDDLAQVDPELPAQLKAVPPGQQRLLQVRIRDVPAELRVAVSEIRVDGEAERLFSIENLSGELTAREASAWRNLIRVLTHEIMNTLTPVTSLAQTCTTMLDRPDSGEDIRQAVTTIARRSEGLMNFVSRYRELLKVPQPVPVPIHVLTALRDAVKLMEAALRKVEVTIDVSPESLELQADRQLLDQLLLNIVKNASEAMQDTPDPQLQLSARLEFGRTVIRIADNGPGIADEIIDQVFIPFFTTRRDGSGIGLSVSRQIMTAHGGQMAFARKDERTVVSLVF